LNNNIISVENENEKFNEVKTEMAELLADLKKK